IVSSCGMGDDGSAARVPDCKYEDLSSHPRAHAKVYAKAHAKARQGPLWNIILSIRKYGSRLPKFDALTSYEILNKEKPPCCSQEQLSEGLSKKTLQPEDVEQGEHASTVGGSANLYSHFGNQYDDISENW
ncbi:hypothetical protein STEG23_020770, partial [Scotinomys teguina]